MSLLNLLTTSGETAAIICGVVAGIIGLGLGGFFFDKYFLARRRCEKQVLELEKKYEFNHSLLVGQDSQYINRLEFISRTNLLYADIHSTYFRRYKEIRDTYDVNFQECVNALRDLLNDNDIKEFKKQYQKYIPTFQNYVESIDALNKDLIDLIKPEEEARQKVLTEKEKFRKVKSRYNQVENELSYIQDSFTKVFDAVEQRFTMYDNLIESAKYDEGNDILPELDKVLESLTIVISKMPNILNEINVVLPAEIQTVHDEYLNLVKEGYPLQSFNIEDGIATLNYDIDKIRDKAKNLRISHIEEEIEGVHNGINAIKNSFKEEQESRKIFEESNTEVNALFQYLENEFIRISNNLPKIKKFYIIDENHLKEIDDITKTLNEVGKDKRRLEIYIHQMGQTPYKILVEKMQDLDKGTQELKAKISTLTNYLGSLKNDSESAFKLIDVQYEKIKAYESLVRNDLSDENKENFDPRFKQAYILIDKINEILSSLPINVVELNEVTNKLTHLASSIFNEVDSLEHFKSHTVNQILIGNRERQKFSDVNTLLDQAEKFYINGEFRKSSELSSQALNTLKAKDGINN